MLASILLLLITIISKLTGFLRELVIASSWGTNEKADIFFLLYLIPYLIFAVIGSGIQEALIPKFISERIKKTTESIFFSVIFYTLIGSIIVYVILFLSSNILLEGIFKIDEQNKMEYLIMNMAIPFIIFISILSAKLLSRESYLPVYLTGIVQNTCVLIYGIFFAPITLMGLIIAFVIGSLSQFIFLCFFVKFSWFSFKIDSSKMKDLTKSIIPIVFSMIVLEISSFVDRIIASNLSDGSVSALNYAQRLAFFSINLFSYAVIQPFYVKMSKIYFNNQYDQAMDYIKKMLLVILIAMFPATLIIYMFSNDFISIVYERGAFNKSATYITNEIFTYFVLCIPIFLIREVTLKYFYMTEEKKVPLYNSLIMLSINIALTLLFSKIIGFKGIGLATFISICISTIFLLLKLPINSRVVKNMIFLMYALLFIIAILSL